MANLCRRMNERRDCFSEPRTFSSKPRAEAPMVAKPYDPTLKTLVEIEPASWAAADGRV